MKKERIQAPVNSIVLNEGQIPWLPENPRQWTREDVELTKASLKRDPDFQEDNPLKLVKTQDGKLLAFAGNLRTTAAKELRWKTFEAILYTPENAEDEETIRRRALLDNGSFGSWDYDRLADKWNEMPFKELGIKVWDDALGADAKQPAAQAQDDDFDETQEVEARCKAGDIWQLGNHRLMCGDSLQEETFEKLMAGELADMVFTDPPYGTTALKWDIKIDLEKMFHIVRGVCKKDACILITGAQPFVTDVINAGRDFFRHEIIWKKTQASGFLQANHAPLKIHENILVFGKTGGTYNPQKNVIGEATGRVRKQSADRAAHYHGNNESTYIDDGTRFPTDVIEFSNWNGALFGNTENAVVHPTQKPVDLVAYLLKTYSNEGELVIDSFLGSGTTIIAAEQTKRKCYGVELDPHYCDIILARWEKLTGQTARKL